MVGPQVRQLFEWYATVNHSLLELSRKAHGEGFSSRKSNQKIPKSAVHKILKNPLYYGEFRWAGNKGKCPAVHAGNWRYQNGQ